MICLHSSCWYSFGHDGPHSGLADLRTWPDYYPNSETAYCPLCTCRKSGHVDDPNGHDDSCEHSECPCHDGL